MAQPSESMSDYNQFGLVFEGRGASANDILRIAGSGPELLGYRVFRFISHPHWDVDLYSV